MSAQLSNTTAVPIATAGPPTTIFGNTSDGRLLIFIGTNVILWACLLIIILYLYKGQRDFAAKMNLIRRDRGKTTERVADRTIFDFHHSPEEEEIIETHDRVMAALNLEDNEPSDHNPLAIKRRNGPEGKGNASPAKKSGASKAFDF